MISKSDTSHYTDHSIQKGPETMKTRTEHHRSCGHTHGHVRHAMNGKSARIILLVITSRKHLKAHLEYHVTL